MSPDQNMLDLIKKDTSIELVFVPMQTAKPEVKTKYHQMVGNQYNDILSEPMPEGPKLYYANKD